MVLEESITACGRCKETGTEAWSWNGLSRLQEGVGDKDKSMVLEWSIMALGSVGRLGQKPRLGTVYHGLKTV